MQGEHNDNSSEISLCASPDRGDVAKIGYSLPVEEETELDVHQVAKRVLRNEEGVIGDLLSLTSFILNQ